MGKILGNLKRSLADVLGKAGALEGFDPASVVDDKFGLPTVQDVIRELEKPGRDPRPEFKTVKFRDDVNEVKDLVDGMILEGVITNVTNFGAFVDIGVHQDGLVHISELSDQYVDDPHKFAKPGQIVTVRVMGTDGERKRISLSLRLTPTERPAKAERPERSERPARKLEDRPARAEGAEKRGDRQDRPRSDRPRSDKPRDERPRQERPAREEKPKEEKIGSFGALLAQAGIKGSK